MYKILDHTSDLEILVEADTFEKMVEDSIMAVSQFVAENLKETEIKEIEVQGKSDEEMLMEALEEIVYLQSAENFYILKVEATFDETLKMILYGGKGEVINEIKAITWHDFWIKGNQAHFICDL